MQESKININRIHFLYEALVKRHASPEETYHAILNEGLKAFNLSLGIISQIEGDRYFLLAVSPTGKDISAGMFFELKNTYCQRVVSERRIISVEHAGEHPGFNTHCQQRVKSDPLTVTTNGLILIHLAYSGLASAITPAFRFCFSR